MLTCNSRCFCLGGVDTSNTAVFGLGPGGSWNVCISGSWTDSGDGSTVKVRSSNTKASAFLELLCSSQMAVLDLTPKKTPKSKNSFSLRLNNNKLSSKHNKCLTHFHAPHPGLFGAQERLCLDFWWKACGFFGHYYRNLLTAKHPIAS